MDERKGIFLGCLSWMSRESTWCQSPASVSLVGSSQKSTTTGVTKVTGVSSEVDQYIIGDPAYPMQAWLMKSLLDTDRLTPNNRTTTTTSHVHSQSRKCAFGCFKRTMKVSPEVV